MQESASNLLIFCTFELASRKLHEKLEIERGMVTSTMTGKVLSEDGVSDHNTNP